MISNHFNLKLGLSLYINKDDHPSFALRSNFPAEDVDISLDQAYRIWTPDTDPGLLLKAFQKIIDYEFHTCIHLMDRYFRRSDWERDAIELQFRELPNSVEWTDNYILQMLGGSDFSSDAEIIRSRLGPLLDIYDKDGEYQTPNNNYEMIFVITYNGRYYGHVYQDVNGWDTVGLIGIRTSIYNMLAPNHGIQKLKDIAYVLLDAYNHYIFRYTKNDRLYIIQPIGPMIRLSRNYGFDEDNSLVSGSKALVNVPQYEFVLIHP